MRITIIECDRCGLEQRHLSSTTLTSLSVNVNSYAFDLCRDCSLLLLEWLNCTAKHPLRESLAEKK